MEIIDNENLVGSVNGIVVGGASLVSGKKGMALYTNGVDQYVDLGFQGDTCLGYFVLCIHGWVTALWIKRESLVNGAVMDTGFMTGYGTRIMFFYSYLSIGFKTTSQKWQVADTPKQGWNHVVVTWQQCYGTKLYIDGELKNTNMYSHRIVISGPASDTSRFVLGADSKHGVMFGGKLDELRIWDTVMSDEDVSALYTVDAGLD